MSENVPPSRWIRLRGLLAFVAIAWGVAASFVAFELVALGGFGALRGSSIALSEAVQQSTVCEAPGAENAPPPVLASAWLFGVYAGAQGRITPWLTPGGQVDSDPDAQQRFLSRVRAMNLQVQSELERLAGQLDVPVPPPFSPVNVVNAIVEYVPFVEGDGNATARAVAAAYGSRACEIYKLGSYWGFGALMVSPTSAIAHPFAVEVTHYAQRLAIPEELWQPMLEPPASNQPFDSDALTNAIGGHLAAGSQP